MKAILKVIKKLSQKIEECEAKLFHLQNLMNAIVPELDGMPKSPCVSSRVERLAVSIANLERKISELKTIRISCRIELIELLEKKISDANVFKVIFYRYGLLKKFNEIAADMNFSESAVFRFHKIGLKNLDVTFSLADNYELDSIGVESKV